ncbi:hypothetical protein SEEM0315_025480 (plasmid) [Salmonella enterica subsp. enterica serovar Muenster str. 0315]|nr:hypothetical protein SEEM0315_025480 [Salmonella enterica subsp. enterica serovar Muenster str. 0315]
MAKPPRRGGAAGGGASPAQGVGAKRSAEGEATPKGRGRRRRGKSGAGRGGQAERGGRSPEALGIEARRGETACLARCAARKPGPQGTP